ncbi:PAS domain-containing protein [Niveispirillum sp.]|uniref:PAS domain-containing protein n=1 Tax=Niveispirillum sp. TaxID=1917217 RepID=UPI001B51D44C|nr:PAS domain-containing protein [Niveispirillum sp.]MBP7337443.1 PAS domain-containing protein [Niveispirillum sp.]
MQPDKSAAEIDHAILVEDRGMLALLLFWWRLKQANGGAVLPTRRQMDPCALPRAILPFMFIYEGHEGGRLRCRLSGTRLRDLFGQDGTGLYLDQMIAPASVPGRSALFHQSLACGLPMFYRGFLVPAGRGWRAFNRLLLPVSVAPGAPATQIMGMVRVFDPPPGTSPLTSADADGLVSARLLDDGACAALAR